MQERWLRALDPFGPAKVVLLHDPAASLKACVVVDNVACGPAIGGVRMSPSVTVQEVRRLARAMTLKSAAAGLPHGGAKAGILASASLAPADKERLVRAFARAMRDVVDYIPGPDMGTDETAMAWIRDEIGRAVGLPRVVGGIPLDEIGATGWGLVAAVESAQSFAGVRLEDARVVVQGFGSVGTHAARFLQSKGGTVVAVSDSHGGVHSAGGLDVPALIAHKAAGQPVRTFQGGRPVSHEQLVGLECEVWIPAAQPDVLTEANVGELRARLVVPGANIPATPAAERALHERGVVFVPDFIANAGGLVCAAVEYAGGSQAAAMETIAERVASNTAEVLTRAKRDRGLPRQAADAMALDRVREAMRYRGGPRCAVVGDELDL